MPRLFKICDEHHERNFVSGSLWLHFLSYYLSILSLSLFLLVRGASQLKDLFLGLDSEKVTYNVMWPTLLLHSNTVIVWSY